CRGSRCASIPAQARAGWRVVSCRPGAPPAPAHAAPRLGIALDAILPGHYPVGVDRPRVEVMDVATTRDEEVARTLASRAFSRHMAFDAIGSVDAEAMDLIRQAVLRAWERAGSPPGALRRAAVLSAELPRLIAENQAPADL